MEGARAIALEPTPQLLEERVGGDQVAGEQGLEREVVGEPLGEPGGRSPVEAEGGRDVPVDELVGGRAQPAIPLGCGPAVTAQIDDRRAIQDLTPGARAGDIVGHATGGVEVAARRPRAAGHDVEGAGHPLDRVHHPLVGYRPVAEDRRGQRPTPDVEDPGSEGSHDEDGGPGVLDVVAAARPVSHGRDAPAGGQGAEPDPGGLSPGVGGVDPDPGQDVGAEQVAAGVAELGDAMVVA